jgi:hypothetical protein
MTTTTPDTDTDTETDNETDNDDDDGETASARMCSGYKQCHLKEILKEKLLVQSGTKYEQMLQLIRFEFCTGGPTGAVLKRVATETIIDETTGEEIQVAKRHKTTIPTPKQIYSRVSKKI